MLSGGRIKFPSQDSRMEVDSLGKQRNQFNIEYSVVSFPDNSFQEFVNSPCMTEIKERSCFIHIDVPGHDENADKLPDR